MAEAKRFNDLLPLYQSDPNLFTEQYLVKAMGEALTNVEKWAQPTSDNGKSTEVRLMLNREPPAPPKAAGRPVNEKLKFVMQVTSLLSQHEHKHVHDDTCGCGHDHSHSTVHLWQAVLGVVFVLNAYLVDWLFEAGTTLASASAFIGAIILGYPIVVTAIKDLRSAV